MEREREKERERGDYVNVFAVWSDCRRGLEKAWQGLLRAAEREHMNSVIVSKD